MFSKDGRREKLIVFTEHKDTLEYLAAKIRQLLGSHDAEHAASNHNDHYDVPESVLKRGAALHAQFAVDYLAAKAE